MTLLADPRFPWPAGSPYDRLAARLRAVGHPGVGPDATARAVADVLFDLMAAGPLGPPDRAVWDEVRRLEHRLVIDFLHYDLAVVPLPADAPAAAPVEPIDLSPLADVPIALPAPPPPPPGPVPLAPIPHRRPPLDVGPVSWNEAPLLGDGHEG